MKPKPKPFLGIPQMFMKVLSLTNKNQVSDLSGMSFPYVPVLCIGLIFWFTWQNFVGGVMDRNYDIINFIWKKSTLRRPGVGIFADIIKIVTIFIKTISKISRKVKELEIMYQIAIYVCISWYSKRGVSVLWFIYFFNLL